MLRTKRQPIFLNRLFIILFVLAVAYIGYVFLFATKPKTAVHSPQPERNGISIGADDAEFAKTGEPFTAAQYDQLANNYGMVHFVHDHILSKAANAQKAAQQLVNRNPNIKVFAYMNTKIWFKGNDWSPATFNEAWLLHDNSFSEPKLIPTKQSCNKKCDYYLDLANTDYQKWAHDVAISWMKAAPFAGVKFDSADTIGDSTDPSDRDTKLWASTHCPAGYKPTAENPPAIACPRVVDYNKGITNLITSTHNDLNALSKQVMFNGIAPSTKRLNRDAGYFNFSDGAMDESFCLDNAGMPTVPLATDFAFIDQHPDKLYLLHSTYATDANKIYGPYCFAAFMMIWQPGYTNWRFGIDYSVSQLSYQLPDKDLNLGNPMSHFVQNGSLYSRTFQNGLVYVNIGSSPVVITLPNSVTRYQDGSAKETFNKGYSYTIPATGAAFFMNTRR